LVILAVRMGVSSRYKDGFLDVTFYDICGCDDARQPPQ
jgi:hypothetical protein